MGNTFIKNYYSKNTTVDPVVKPVSRSIDFSQWAISPVQLKLSKHVFDEKAKRKAYFITDILNHRTVVEICEGLLELKLGYFKAESYQNGNVFYTMDVTFEELSVKNDPFVVISFVYYYSGKDPVYAAFARVNRS